MLYFSIILLILVIIMCGFASTSKKRLDNNVNVNNFVNKEFYNFNKEQILYISDCESYIKDNNFKMMIWVDATNKKVLFIDYKIKNAYIVNFAEILDYQIYENNTNVTSGGAIGGFFTTVYSAETTGNCKDLRLILRINNVTNPHITYEIIGDTFWNTGVSKDSKCYKKCIEDLQRVVSFLEVVKNENQQKRTQI